MAATQALVTQPAFAPQMTGVPSPLGTSNITGALQRGFMIWERASSLYSGGGPLGDGRDVINFLFNPSTVTTDYNVGNASLQAAMLYTVPDDSGNLLSPLLQQTVSFQLYFDRTFELLYGTPTSAVNDPAQIGVQADVYQFMQFTGLLASLDDQSLASNATVVQDLGTQTAATTNTGGIMMMMPAYVYFGNAFNQANSRQGATQFSAVGTQLAFYGFISEWSVEYTHWTTSMVPIRCAISVNFMMLPQPASSNADATATWKDAATLQQNYVAAPSFPTPTTKAPGSGSGFPGIS